MSGEPVESSGSTEDATAAEREEPVDRAADTREAIMEATYRALCAHGYADLTMQDIADESATSKASLHYHYDTKEALLLAFLEHLYRTFTDEHADPDGEHAVERLVDFVDGILCREEPEPDPEERFGTALLEIKAQAPYVDAYREQLQRIDRFVREEVEAIVADGIEEGTVRRDVDPEATAAFVATTIVGVNTRRVSLGETRGTRRAFLEYVREHLLVPGADVVVDPDAGEPTTDEGPADPRPADGSGED